MAKKISEERMGIIEDQIKNNEKIFDYRTVQWELQHICNLLESNNSSEEQDFKWWELFVPSYQRDYVRNETLKCNFIESLFLNIPIPYIFLSEDAETSQFEIIDWYQRIRTIYEFINNKFKLKNLKKIDSLNGLKFEDLTTIRQNFFKRKICNIVIFETLEMEQKQEMFSRINTTSKKLTNAELRKGAIWWPFYNFLKDLSNDDLMTTLAPLSEQRIKREEWTELLLRFFAYTNDYENYDSKVDEFLTKYMKKVTKDILKPGGNDILEDMRDEYIKVFKFVQDNFPSWFMKYPNDTILTSRAYFEAISVWVWLALREANWNSLNTEIIPQLLADTYFQEIVSSDWANSKRKFSWRIDCVKNALLHWQLPREWIR